jgi:prepilin-type N-terminal cleavage/methylation domain-containing protein
MPVHQRNYQRAGFTLMELLVVITIILAIAGMLIPSISYFRRQMNESATGSLVRSVAAAITTYPKRDVSVPNPPVTVPPTLPDPGLVNLRKRRLWDFNSGSDLTSPPVYDRILDGDPDLDPGFAPVDSTAARFAGYRGFLGMTGMAAPKGNVDAEGRLLDNWKRFIHISFSADAYGSAWFGVWSNGADGLEGTADDICSWK